jgi:hypothetical protein
MKSRKAFILSAALLGSLFLSGCGAFGDMYNNLTGLVGLNRTATVIAKVAYIRSSYAVVAADLLEVKRGQTLDILEENEFEKILWYRVRAQDEDATEGWIEAQNVITSELLEKSKKLAEEFKSSQAQATGQLRAASNLRLSPDMNKENLLFKLDNGSTFEIIDWMYVPKAQDVSDVDDASKGEQKQTKKTRNEEIEAAKEANEPETLTDKYDVWYQVRLDPSVSPAPIGWLFGRQVELQVPSDIVFYQHNNKKFVTWQRLDDATDKVGDKSDKISKPGSWVVLWRTNQVKAIDAVEPDFDGILVLGFDKYGEQIHYTAYTTRGDTSVWGVLPLKVEGTNDSKTFTLKLRNNTTGQIEDKRFVVTSGKTRMTITPPPDIANYEKKDK